MPLRRSAPIKFTGVGLSDATDATNSSRGAMRALTNLVPDPKTRGNWVCRPAAVDRVDLNFAAMIAPGFISGYLVVGDIVYGLIATGRNPGHDEPFAYNLETAAFLPVGGITAENTPISPPATGPWTPPTLAQVATRIIVTHPGFPGEEIKFGWFDVSEFSSTITGNTSEMLTFVGDTVVTDNALFIYGVPPGILPGDAQIGFTVTGTGLQPDTKIVETFDTAQAFTGDTTTGSSVITGIPSTSALYVGLVVESTSFPAQSQILNVGPGSQITLDQNATITATAVPMAAIGLQVQIDKPALLSANATTFNFTNPSVITGNPSIFGLQPGLTITGPGLAPGTVVVSSEIVTAEVVATLTTGLNSAFVNIDTGGLMVGMDVSGNGIPPGTTLLDATGNLLVFSNPSLLTGTSTLFFVGAQIHIAPPATSAVTAANLTISGGSTSAPLWGAGDTQPFGLPNVPVGVAQMNGRAWFADAEGGIPFSDVLLPCSRSSDTQALVPANGFGVTAIAPVMLNQALIGGVVQALMAFQESKAIQQIAGDPTTNDLRMNLLPVQTGTIAPNSLAPSALGLFFMSPQGLRLIDTQAKVSDPIGQDGDGVVQAFLNLANPPHDMAPAASRLCAAVNGRNLRIDTPLVDGTTTSYWFDVTRKIWTGPHTGAASLCRQWRDTFLITPASRLALMQQADDAQRPDSIYTENGLPLDIEWETSLLPDNGEAAMNMLVESSLMIALMPDELIRVEFLNEVRNPIDGLTINGFVIPPAIWGQMVLGVTYAGPDTGMIRQRAMPWTMPVVFKQGSLNLRALASPTLTIGNWYARIEVASYLLEVPQIPAAPFPFGNEVAPFLLANDGMTILTSNVLTFLTVEPMQAATLVSNDGFTALKSSSEVVLENRP